MFKVVTFLESIGLKQKGEELKMSIGEAADKAKGLEGRLKIKHELYRGENRAKVDHYIIPEAKKAAKKPKKAEKPIEIDEDDLPFEI